MATISDLGLYGPESVTWRVHADPTMAVGGLRALFLQGLHPVTMAGVAMNSDYRRDPWGRLFRTVEYVAVTTYGTMADAGRAAERVRRVHNRLSVIDPTTGHPRRVDDPELLLWVHCCEIDSFLDAARRGGLRLSPGEADRYVAEQVHSARLVGIAPGTVEVPRTVRQLADYFDQMRPELRATRATYEAARFMVAPPMRWWVRYATPAAPSWATLVGLAFSTLPRWARSLYTHLPATPTTDLSATLGLRAFRTAVMALPASLREGPQLRAAKARVAAVPVRRLEALPA